MKRLILAILVAQATARPAEPLEPIAAMVDALRTHSVIAVTAGHGEARGYAFMQMMIHDPRLVAAINDIVVEEGSARYQDVADRYVRCATSGATLRSQGSVSTGRGRSSIGSFAA